MLHVEGWQGGGDLANSRVLLLLSNELWSTFGKVGRLWVHDSRLNSGYLATIGTSLEGSSGNIEVGV